MNRAANISARRGFSLVELTVTVAVLASVAMVMVPLAGRESGSRLTAATSMLRDDLEQARHRTVVDPGTPISLILDADGGGWMLAHDNRSRPILRVDGRPWRVRFGDDVAAALEGLRVRRLDDPSTPSLTFDGEGVARADDTPRFEVADGDDAWMVHIGLVTGVARTTTHSIP
ncbi:MAG: hypothetical protein CMJ51_03290 [Planctomycetaceae bacterium]|nr:hypothetical protein [Planctomycetaceae bacterium]